MNYIIKYISSLPKIKNLIIIQRGKIIKKYDKMNLLLNNSLIKLQLNMSSSNAGGKITRDLLNFHLFFP